MTPPLSHLLAAEAIGAFLVVASVVGSGILAEQLPRRYAERTTPKSFGVDETGSLDDDSPFT